MKESLYIVLLRSGTREKILTQQVKYRGSLFTKANQTLRSYLKGIDIDLTKVPKEVAIWVEIRKIYGEHEAIINELIIKEAEE